MSKIITIKEANISTLTVELKAIHINSKQMTLSVFRQIQEEYPFFEDWTLDGIPWGTVNYYWDKCPQFNASVLHVVWQKDKELRRWRFSDILEGRSHHDQSHHSGDIISHFCREINGEIKEINDWLKYDHQIGGNKDYGVRRPEAFREYQIKQSPDEYKKSCDTKESLNKRLLELNSIATQKTKEACLYIDNHRKAYERIAALPQLYIAA